MTTERQFGLIDDLIEEIEAMGGDPAPILEDYGLVALLDAVEASELITELLDEKRRLLR